MRPIAALRTFLAALAVSCLVAVPALAQAPTIVTSTTPYNLVLVPISSTAAVNTATTLTIPAAAGLYNYVCWLAYQINNDATGAAVSNAVTTSTNFNSFAIKVSFPATVSIDSGVQTVLGSSNPVGGCAKSTVAGTATTFVSTASLTHTAFTWYALYFQAP